MATTLLGWTDEKETQSLTPAAARTAIGATTVGSNLITLTNPGAIRFPRVNADSTVSLLDASGTLVALGATTVGNNLFTSANPSAVRFLRVNADNTITWRTAAELATDIGAGGSVTSVAAGNGMDFTTITGSGSVTLGTPSTVTGTSTNSVTSTSHTHATNFNFLVANGTTDAASTYPDLVSSVGDVTAGGIPTAVAGHLTARSGINRVLQFQWRPAGGTDVPELYFRTSHVSNGGGGWTSGVRLWHSGIFDPASKADDSAVWKLSGNQTSGGVKTMSDSTPYKLILERTGSATNSGIEYKTSGGSVYAGIGTSGTFAIGSSADLSNSANRWVGISSSALTSLVNIVGTNGVTSTNNHFTGGSGYAVLNTSASGGTILLRPNGLGSATGEFAVYSNGSVKLSGSGSDSPRLQLQSGSTTNSGGIDFLSSGGNWRGGVYWNPSDNEVNIFTAGDGVLPRLSINSAGKITMRMGDIVIGNSGLDAITINFTTNDGTGWIHANSGNLGFLQYNTFAWGAYINASNDWAVVGNITAYASDGRLKTNVKPVCRDVVDRFFDLFPVEEFDWDYQQIRAMNAGFNPTAHHEVGAIAQKVACVLPGMVQTHSHNGILTLNWDKPVPYLISEVQDHRRRLSEIEALIRLLEEKL